MASNFLSNITSSLDIVRTILGRYRTLELPTNVSHTYSDKFLLAEFVTNSALAANLNILEAMGVTSNILNTLQEWSEDRSVTLRFTASETCEFSREVTREETISESSVKILPVKIQDKTLLKVTDYYWNFTHEYQIDVYPGTDRNNGIVLQQRKVACEVKSSTKESPRKSASTFPPVETPLTFLLENLTEKHQTRFSIHRKKESCHTPRRNEEIEDSLRYFQKFSHWTNSVKDYFKSKLFPVQPHPKYTQKFVGSAPIFVPVVPVFNGSSSNSQKQLKTTTPTPEDDSIACQQITQSVFDFSTMNGLFKTQRDQIRKTFSAFSNAPDRSKENSVVSKAELELLELFSHQEAITRTHLQCVDYIESILVSQLIAAIGKRVTPIDFENYMEFHNRKHFRDEFTPRSFCYAIRRPDHYPEGILSIEGPREDPESLPVPISTIVNQYTSQSAIEFALNASTRVKFRGERFIHAWIGHQFSQQPPPSVKLSARARQYSGFLVLIGRIASSSLFEPKYGMIVQNQDEWEIPLKLEQIPSAGEFRDAIESLSPKQQAFAKAFRAMQLESTLFGVLVLQIKPQLERLLRLTAGSLTKEIQLTQDLIQMILEYQVPTDLLRFESDDSDASAETRLDGVKSNVQKLQATFQNAKQQELKDEVQKAQFAMDELREIAPDIGESMILDTLEEPTYERKKFLPKKPSIQKKCVEKKSFAKKSLPTRPQVLSAPVQARAAPPVQSQAVPSPMQSVPSPSPAEQKAPERPDEPKIPFSEIHETLDGDGFDFASIPGRLDEQFEKFDDDRALRPVIIHTAEVWKKRSRKNMFLDFVEEPIAPEAQTEERNRTFDLIDALSCSGSLPFEEAALHVVMGASHHFDTSLMDTVVQKNINPIDKVERSTLLIASAIHQGAPVESLINPDHVDRVKKISPALFELKQIAH